MRIVILRSFDGNKKLLDVVQKYATSKATEAKLVIFVEGARQGKSIAKKTQAMNEGVVGVIPVLKCADRNDALTFVLEQLKKSNRVMDRKAGEALVDRCGLDYGTLYWETQRLFTAVDGDIGIDHVKHLVSWNREKENFLDFYMAIMDGNYAKCRRVAESIAADMSLEPIQSCIMKVAEATLHVAMCDSQKEAMSFAIKKRKPIDSNLGNRMWFSEESASSEKAPSSFLYKVGGRVSKRYGSLDATMDMFVACYNSFGVLRFNNDSGSGTNRLLRILESICSGRRIDGDCRN